MKYSSQPGRSHSRPGPSRPLDAPRTSVTIRMATMNIIKQDLMVKKSGSSKSFVSGPDQLEINFQCPYQPSYIH